MCKPTAGIGHLLSVSERKLYPVGSTVTDRQIEEWFTADVNNACKVATDVLPVFSNLDEVRQRIIVNLCFNLGYKFGDFKKCIKAITDGDYIRAASELSNSAWYTQVGRRGREMCEAMRQGYYGFE